MNATARARLNVALSMAIFGTLPLFVRQVHASSAMIALLRAAIALIALASVYLLRGGSGLRVESKKEMLLLLASGAAMGVNWILLFEAYNYVSVQIATLLYYFAPVIVALAGAALFHERMSAQSAGFALPVRRRDCCSRSARTFFPAERFVRRAWRADWARRYCMRR